MDLFEWNELSCGTNDAYFPLMSVKEYGYFVHVFHPSKIRESIILEWGSGGSTNYLAWYSRKLLSIENSAYHCEKIMRMNATKCNISKNKLVMVCLNEVELYSFGTSNNVDDVIAKKFRSYVEVPTKYLNSVEGRYNRPDIIFVDGRFRVACILQGALLIRGLEFSPQAGFIVVHDYMNRPHYHVVEKYLVVYAYVESLAVLILKSVVDWESLKQDLDFSLSIQS